MSKKAGVLGSGKVAQVLAAGLHRMGYDVMVGTRDTGKLKEWGSKNPLIKIDGFEQAAGFGELIVLAVKGTAAEPLVMKLAPLLSGKTVIDTTNPIGEGPPENGVLNFFSGMNESLMERLQRHAPAAHFVKAFSCVGNAFMVNPAFPEGKPTMFIAGNDEASRKEVTRILDEFGWETADMGKAEAARAIEPLCMLWCIPGILRNDWKHAFRLMKL